MITVKAHADSRSKDPDHHAVKPFMKAKHKTESPPSRANILVVEDEADLQDLLRYNIAREGFNVRCATTGEEAMHAIRQETPDIIVLDLMLPGMDGLEVCRLVKTDKKTESASVIILTAKGEEADIVVGLELGADDYVTKPFSPRVLIARIKAVMRRLNKNGTPQEHDEAILRIHDLTIDPARHELRVADQPVDLTHTEFRILETLAKRPGRVFTRSQIIQLIQDGPTAVTDRSVDVHITSLRRKLADAARYIQTVRGVGYRIKAGDD